MPTRFDSVSWRATDNQTQYFGTNDDFELYFDATNMVLRGRSEDDELNFGVEDRTLDVRFVSNTTGADVQWDSSRFQFHFADDAILGFGGANDAAADVTIVRNSTSLTVAVAAENEVWNFGEEDANMDVVFQSNTTGRDITWDPSASGGTLLFAADTTAAAMPRLQIVDDAAPAAGTQSGGEIFLGANTTGALYLCAFRNATVISGVELGTAFP